MQVLRNLIDETLQIQEAKARRKSTVDAGRGRPDLRPRRGSRTSARTSARWTPISTRIGSSPASLKRQIRGELAWQRLLRRNVAPFVNVSAEEVNEMMDRLEASQAAPRNTASAKSACRPRPRPATQVLANADKIVEQLKQGGSFVAYARQYSEASTAAVGGDLGWIRLEQLPSRTRRRRARRLQPGQLVGPIENSGRLFDPLPDRQAPGADRRSARRGAQPQADLDRFPRRHVRSRRASGARRRSPTAVQAIKGCGDAEAAAAGDRRAGGRQRPDRHARDLPEQLQSDAGQPPGRPDHAAVRLGRRTASAC